MIKIIKYFFYKIYSVSLASGEEDAGWAMTLVAMFGLTNMITIFNLKHILLHEYLSNFSLVFYIITSSVLFYLYYVLLQKNGKSQIIVKEFKSMQGKKTLLNFLLLVYISVSIVLFIYTLNVVRSINMN